MTSEQQQELLHALRHGRDGDDEFDLILAADIESIEPLIDNWIAEAREDERRKARERPARFPGGF